MAGAPHPHLIPLVVGVTGHRVLPIDDADRLAGQIVGALRTLTARFPATPLLILSSLAEGADRLVARLAIEHFSAQLVVPLPLAPTEYSGDFSDQASRDEFQTLLSEATRWFTVGGQDAAEGQPNDRRRSYSRAGAFIVRHAHVLVAVWDGKPARGEGGTAEVVSWWRAGRSPYDADATERLLPSTPGPLAVCGPTAATTTWNPRPDDSGSGWSLLDRLDEFNQAVRDELAAGAGPALANAAAEVISDWRGRDLNEPASGARAAADRFASADRLAVRAQSEAARLIALMYLVFGAALLLFGLIDWIPQLVLVHVASIPAIALLVRRIRQRRLEEHSLDYRALAEGLRVLTVWRAAGLGTCVSDNYLNRHAGVLVWIRRALAAVELVAPSRGGHIDSGATIDWVRSQRAYFRTRRQALSRRAARWTALSRVSFGLTFIVALLYAAFVTTGTAAGWPAGHTGFQAVLGFWGAAGVVAEAYRRQRMFDELIRQYTLGERLFVSAEARLEDPTAPGAGVLLALGREALAENGEWLWLKRAQPVEIPKG